MEPTSIGVVDGALNTEPAITSTPSATPVSGEPASAPLESNAAPLDGDTPPDDAPASDAPVNPGDAYAAWLAEQPPEVVRAEHARLAKVPTYDAIFNRDKSQRENALRGEIGEQLRLEAEEARVMEGNARWLDNLVKTNPAAAAQAAYDDDAARQVSNGQLDAAGYRKAQNDIALWRENQTVAPTRLKIASEVADQTLVALRDHLAADPDWEGVAGKLTELAKVEEQGPQAVATFIKRLADERVKSLLPGIRKEEQTKAEAKYQNGAADDAFGAPSQEPVRAGMAGTNGFSTLDEAVQAHINGQITNDQMRAYNRRFGRTN